MRVKALNWQDELRQFAARHPCPKGYTPKKSELGKLIDKYGIPVPLSRLHTANTIGPKALAAKKASDAIAERNRKADLARQIRQERMAEEWEASRE